MVLEEKRKCILCGKKLRSIGSDWKDRKFHKTCYKKRNEGCMDIYYKSDED